MSKNNLYKKYKVKHHSESNATPQLERVNLRLSNPELSNLEESGRPNTYYVDGMPSGKDSTYQYNYYARGTRGDPGAYWQTYLSDPLVKSSVDSTHEGLVSGDWAVVAPACSDDHELCLEQAAFVSSSLLSKPSSWKEFLKGWTLGDRVYGFSLWEIIDNEDGGISKLAYRRPGTVKRWVFSEDGRQWIGTEFEYEGGQSDVYIEAENLLIYSTGIGLDLEGVSAIRPVVRWTEIKQLITQIETAAAESHGNGYRTVKATGDLFDTGDLQRIKDEINAASALDDPIFAFPGYEMDWISPGGKLPDFQSLRTYCDSQIALALQATGSLVGLGKYGTQALAETKDQQENIRRISYFGTSVCDLINEHIVRRIVDTVWGPQEHYPELTFNLGSETKDPDRLNKVIQAVQAGILDLTNDDRNQIREELGFDPVADAEVAPEVKPEFSHNLTLSKKDIEGLSGALEKIESKAAKEAQTVIKSMRDAYVNRSADITNRMDLRGLTKAISDEYQPAIRNAIQPSVRNLIETGKSSVLYELGVTDKIAKASATAAPFGSNSFAIAEADRIATHITNVNSSYLENNAVSELEGNVRNKTKPPIQKATATKSLIAGYTGRSINQGRTAIISSIQEQARNKGIKDTRVMAEYSSVLEFNTCIPCAHADGERAEVGSSKYNRLNPPNICDGGDRCRCIWSYILPSEEGYQDILNDLE